MFSQFCIRRPIFASVMSIIIVLAGLMAARILPVSQYPDISPPSVSISASYSGADAQTLARTIAAPLEDQLSGVEGLLYYTTSIRSNGDVRISCVFDVGTNPNDAMLEINNRVRTAERRLPEKVRQDGVRVRKRSEEVLLMMALTSPDDSMNVVQMADWATLNLIDELSRIPGVGDVSIFGNVQGAMRIWLNPDKMALMGVTVQDVEKAIENQNRQYAAGRIGAAPTTKDQQLFYTITTKGQLLTVKEFEDITVRSNGADGIVRIKDVARVEVGKRSYDNYNSLDGKQAVTVGVYLQTGANAMSTAELVKAKILELAPLFPESIQYTITDDTTVFVKASLKEVAKTLCEAVLLVLLVVYVFLQNWRATIIPMIAVPVSLIGTMAGLWACGFSINTLTLFAMTLAIGIVVDDAIVVLENVERLMVSEGLTARQASKKAMKEVASALVAIVLVLSAVFIPVAFLGGMAGELYRQFAVTISIAVILSGFVALTLTPALCAILLKNEHNKEKPKFFLSFNRGLGRFTGLFQRWVGMALHHRVGSAVILLLVCLACWQMVKIVPTSFVPREDQGYVRMSLTLPEGATINRTEEVTERLHQEMRKIEGVNSVLVMTGFDTVGNDVRQNAATFVLRLKHWDDRQNTANDILAILRDMEKNIPEGVGTASVPAPIRGLGSAAGFSGYLQSRENDDPLVLQQVTDMFVDALKQSPILTSLRSTAKAEAPMLAISVDEAKALALGVNISDIYGTLAAFTGSTYVNDFTRNGKINRVIIQAEPEYRMKPEDLGRSWVRSSSGQMVPMSTLVSWERTSGSESLARMNGYLAARFMGQAIPGVSSGDAIAEVERIANEVLPAGYAIGWVAQAFQEKRLGSSAAMAVVFGIIMVFLILAAQYERWSLPVAVVLAVPFSALGALVTTYFTGHSNDIYFQIGLLVLIGLTAKNAILIVEFAAQKLEAGKSVFDAALEAASLRFRPILMTSLAFILGVIPLALATGPGAAARQSMGTGVVGGMIVATFIATVFVPVFFTWFVSKNVKKREDEDEDKKSPFLKHEEKEE